MAEKTAAFLQSIIVCLILVEPEKGIKPAFGWVVGRFKNDNENSTKAG
jgi:hypothetical protein